MLTRFNKRVQEANRIARGVMQEYGGDYDSAAERVLAIVDGQRWLERLVLKEMQRLSGFNKYRKAA